MKISALDSQHPRLELYQVPHDLPSLLNPTQTHFYYFFSIPPFLKRSNANYAYLFSQPWFMCFKFPTAIVDYFLGETHASFVYNNFSVLFFIVAYQSFFGGCDWSFGALFSCFYLLLLTWEYNGERHGTYPTIGVFRLTRVYLFVVGFKGVYSQILMP